MAALIAAIEREGISPGGYWWRCLVRASDGGGLLPKRLTALLCLAAMALAGAALMTGGSRSAVDWRPVRAVVLESDDWGLAGFVPDGEAWQEVDREALRPGRFPEVYWRSTLEDSAMVAQSQRQVLRRTTGARRSAGRLPAELRHVGRGPGGPPTAALASL